MTSTLRPALVLFGALTLLVGGLYPLAVRESAASPSPTKRPAAW